MSKHRVTIRLSLAEASALLTLASPEYQALLTRELSESLTGDQARASRAAKRAFTTLRVAATNAVDRAANKPASDKGTDHA